MTAARLKLRSVSYFELDGASDTSVSQKKTFELSPKRLGGPAKDLFGEFNSESVHPKCD